MSVIYLESGVAKASETQMDWSPTASLAAEPMAVWSSTRGAESCIAVAAAVMAFRGLL